MKVLDENSDSSDDEPASNTPVSSSGKIMFEPKRINNTTSYPIVSSEMGYGVGRPSLSFEEYE